MPPRKFKSLSLSEPAYAGVQHAIRVLRARGLDALPPELRPERLTNGAVIDAALRALCADLAS